MSLERLRLSGMAKISFLVLAHLAHRCDLPRRKLISLSLSQTRSSRSSRSAAAICLAESEARSSLPQARSSLPQARVSSLKLTHLGFGLWALRLCLTQALPPSSSASLHLSSSAAPGFLISRAPFSFDVEDI
nr:hypothetical protein CFP56_45912 [Quercus suber]